jgi:hypothetical protein
VSKFDKGKMGDNSSKSMLNEIDDQLDTLAALIVGFLQTVDQEDELYFLVEKLCDYDDIIMDKLSFAIKSYQIDKDVEHSDVIPSRSRYAH